MKKHSDVRDYRMRTRRKDIVIEKNRDSDSFLCSNDRVRDSPVDEDICNIGSLDRPLARCHLSEARGAPHQLRKECHLPNGKFPSPNSTAAVDDALHDQNGNENNCAFHDDRASYQNAAHGKFENRETANISRGHFVGSGMANSNEEEEETELYWDLPAPYLKDRNNGCFEYSIYSDERYFETRNTVIHRHLQTNSSHPGRSSRMTQNRTTVTVEIEKTIHVHHHHYVNDTVNPSADYQQRRGGGSGDGRRGGLQWGEAGPPPSYHDIHQGFINRMTRGPRR